MLLLRYIHTERLHFVAYLARLGYHKSSHNKKKKGKRNDVCRYPGATELQMIRSNRGASFAPPLWLWQLLWAAVILRSLHHLVLWINPFNIEVWYVVGRCRLLDCTGIIRAVTSVLMITVL